MSDERALLAAICAHPEEDTPRLAYADWLDEFAGALPTKKQESGRARAELIRVQCELARLPEDEEDAATAVRRAELRARYLELIEKRAWQTAWLKPVTRPPKGYEELIPRVSSGFVRGFPRFAAADVNALFDVGEALFDISPVHEINCNNTHNDFSAARFLALPWLKRVRRLTFRSPTADIATTERVFSAPGLAGLEELALRPWRFGPPGHSAAGGSLANLRRLELLGGDIIEPYAFVRLSQLLPTNLRVREFDFGETDYGAHELYALAALPQFQTLRRLTLYAPNPARAGRGPLGTDGIRAITSAPYWRTLRAFTPNIHVGFSAVEVAALAAAPPAPELRTLELQSAQLDNGLERLTGSPILTTVTKLDLSYNHFGDDGARLLAGCRSLDRLLNLQLEWCQIGPDGMKALAEAPWAQNIVCLNLSECSIRGAGVDALSSPSNFPRLRFLNLRGMVNRHGERDKLRSRFGTGVTF